MQRLRGGYGSCVAMGHMQTQHGREAEGILRWESMSPDEEPRAYRMVFMTSGGQWNCPIEVCLGRLTTRTAMRVLFFLPECSEYRYHFGGGKPSPEMVSPMRHDGDLVCTEREEPVTAFKYLR